MNTPNSVACQFPQSQQPVHPQSISGFDSQASSKSVNATTVQISPLEEIDRAILSIRAGNQSAFRRIVALTERSVRLTILSVLSDKDLVDDITQEVYVKIYKQLGNYSVGTNFLAWIKTYARFEALSERKRWIRNQRMLHVDDSNFSEPPIDPLGIIDVAASDLSVAMMELIEQLPPKYREVIQRFYFEQQSTRDMARSMKRSEASVRVLLHRARGILVDEYKKSNEQQD